MRQQTSRNAPTVALVPANSGARSTKARSREAMHSARTTREERKQVSSRMDGEYSARLSPEVSSNLLKRSAVVSSSMSMAIESVIVEEERKEYSWVGPAPGSKAHRETIKPKTSRRIEELA